MHTHSYDPTSPKRRRFTRVLDTYVYILYFYNQRDDSKRESPSPVFAWKKRTGSEASLKTRKTKLGRHCKLSNYPSYFIYATRLVQRVKVYYSTTYHWRDKYSYFMTSRVVSTGTTCRGNTQNPQNRRNLLNYACVSSELCCHLLASRKVRTPRQSGRRALASG